MKSALKYSCETINSLRTHGHLLKGFVQRDIKGRFAGTAGGMLWSLINPLMTVIVYVFIFGMVIRIPVTVEETGTDRFALYFFSGFFPWLFFSEGISRSAGVLLENANLITKVVFPVELLPIGSVISAFLINGAGMLFFLLYAAFTGYFHFTWIVLFLLIPMLILFTWGISFVLAGLTVFIRDMREILGMILMVWFFATPIIYPVSLVPDFFRFFIHLNPMAVFVSLFRDTVILHQLNLPLLLFTALFSILSYGFGAWFFMKIKPSFGDVL